jgi:hypothetical protein
MKKEFILDLKDFPYGDYIDINSLSVRYRVDGSDISDPNTWYIMGVDVAEEPESIKRQKERDKKIDSILN